VVIQVFVESASEEPHQSDGHYPEETEDES
jgi:hypothetical protein